MRENINRVLFSLTTKLKGIEDIRVVMVLPELAPPPPKCASPSAGGDDCQMSRVISTAQPPICSSAPRGSCV